MNWTWLLVYAAIIALFYFVFIRPAAKRAREQQNVISSLAEGMRVMLSTGIFGTIQAVGERQLVVELAPGVEVTCLKQAVARIVSADDEEFEYTDSDVDDSINEDDSVDETVTEELDADSKAGETVGDADAYKIPEDWTGNPGKSTE